MKIYLAQKLSLVVELTQNFMLLKLVKQNLYMSLYKLK